MQSISTLVGFRGAMLAITMLIVADAAAMAEKPEMLKAPFDAAVARHAQEKWARYLGRSVIEVGKSGLSMTLIPPGEFMMGRSESLERLAQLEAPSVLDDAYKADKGGIKERLATEQPQHRVRITRPFYVGTFNVTVEQFRKFIKATGYRTDAEKNKIGGMGYTPTGEELFSESSAFNWKNPGFKQGDDHPVVNVSWNDAVEYSKWISNQEEKHYRLSTEAEFEYACRAGTTTFFSFGDDPVDLVKYANISDKSYARELYNPPTADEFVKAGWAVPLDDGFPFTSPVGHYKPNPFGLFDMHGNAGTWCQDGEDDEYYSKSPTDDPTGPAKSDFRVHRGGAWCNTASALRSASRNCAAPDARVCTLGFRVVCECDK